MSDLVAAVVASLVAVAFCLSTLERFVSSHKPQELAWSIALGMFAIASSALAVGAGSGWSSATYRVFILFGGIVNVPVLALGTIYLLGNKQVGAICSAGVGLFAAFAAGIVVATPTTHRLAHHTLAQASHVFPPLIEVLAGVGSSVGSIVIIGGALYSLFRRRGRRIAVANVLIVVGTLVTGASGIANSAFDKMTAFAVSLGVGITIIFIGFLVTAPKIDRLGDVTVQPASVNRSAR